MSLRITWCTYQKHWEINALYQFLEDKHLSRVLEIGTQYGGTALVWAYLVDPQDGKVFCVDQGFPEPNAYRHHGLAKRVIEILGNSHDPVIKDEVREMVGECDFLFIDGDHSYKGVKEDFESYSPLVREGGWIGFHDILDTDYHRSGRAGVIVEVSDLWNEIKDKYEITELIDPNDQSMMGIGVIKWSNK